jgi:hypothetical protein
MILVKTAWIPLLFAILFVPSAGCGGAKTDPVLQQQEQHLKEIQEMYFLVIKEKKDPPTKLADLDNPGFAGIYPGAVQALHKGTYVVVWGITSKDSGTILAYEKDAPTKGGLAVMADGTVRTVTSDQLKAVKK